MKETNDLIKKHKDVKLRIRRDETELAELAKHISSRKVNYIHKFSVDKIEEALKNS